MLFSSNHILNDSQPMSVAYLEKLNPEQRQAVEHGVREKGCAPSTPLLVIAGAGSGKTNTLAHRVAHLIVNAHADRVLTETSAGGSCVNASIVQFVHDNLPFGGINNSGLGNAHGFYGFRAFSHERPILEDKFSVVPMFFPPYTPRVKQVIKWTVRYLS